MDMTENDKQTEEKIFDSATEIFEEKGMDGARMQDIADHAGINKSLLHYYFRTKDQLFNAVFEKLAAKMLRKFSPVFEKDLSLEEKIRFFFKQHIEFMQENPRLPSFILNEINRKPARIKKLLKNIDIKKFWETLEEQHREEFAMYNITIESLPQIMTTIASMSVFPFAAKPILEGIMENFGLSFEKYIEERKTFAADFVISAIKSRKK
jgi:TetR/AcrR family transcriptional regulator